MKTVLVAFALAGVLVSGPSWGKGLRGTASSLASPLVREWLREVQAPSRGDDPALEVLPCEEAVRLFMDRGAHFAVVESGFTPEEGKELLARPALDLPVAIAGVAVVYNVPGVPEGLQLSPGLLSLILLGEVANWNHPKIVQMNPGLSLPAMVIRVVPRSAGSGTRDLLPSFLMRMDLDRTTRLSDRGALVWPTGKVVRGDPQVLESLSAWAGSLGVIDASFAHRKEVPTAAILNASGRFVRPSPASLAAAASDLVRLPENFQVSLSSSSVIGAYPLSSFLWCMTYRDPAKVLRGKGRGKDLADLLGSILTVGQGKAEGLGFAPLPGHLRDQVLERAGTMVRDRP
jgi:phosphate transport system substrate-binding protein